MEHMDVAVGNHNGHVSTRAGIDCFRNSRSQP